MKKLLRDHKGHIIQSCKSKWKQSFRFTLIHIKGNITTYSWSCVLPQNLMWVYKTAKLSTSPATLTPPLLPSMERRWKAFLFSAVSEHLHSLLQPSPFPTLFQFNYSWLFPIPSCLRDVHLRNKDTLTLGTEKRKEERQNIHQISNLHENKPHCSAGKKWIEMRTCQERGSIISIWPNKRASTEL